MCCFCQCLRMDPSNALRLLGFNPKQARRRPIGSDRELARQLKSRCSMPELKQWTCETRLSREARSSTLLNWLQHNALTDKSPGQQLCLRSLPPAARLLPGVWIQRYGQLDLPSVDSLDMAAHPVWCGPGDDRFLLSVQNSFSFAQLVSSKGDDHDRNRNRKFGILSLWVQQMDDGVRLLGGHGWRDRGLLVASSDEVLSVIDVNRPDTALRSYDIPGATCFAENPTTNALSFGTRDGRVGRLDPRSSKAMAEPPDNAPVLNLAWNPDGTHLAAGYVDEVRVLDYREAKRMIMYEAQGPVRALKWRDRHVLGFGTMGDDPTLVLVNLNAPKLIRILAVDAEVTGLCFRNGLTITSHGRDFQRPGSELEGSVQVWDLQTADRGTRGTRGDRADRGDHGKPIVAVQLSPFAPILQLVAFDDVFMAISTDEKGTFFQAEGNGPPTRSVHRQADRLPSRFDEFRMR